MPIDRTTFRLYDSGRVDPLTVARLQAYVRDQDSALIRANPFADAPWPDPENVMLKHLVARAALMRKADEDTALVWLATHAWFEGGLDERSR